MEKANRNMSSKRLVCVNSSHVVARLCPELVRIYPVSVIEKSFSGFRRCSSLSDEIALSKIEAIFLMEASAARAEGEAKHNKQDRSVRLLARLLSP